MIIGSPGFSSHQFIILMADPVITRIERQKRNSGRVSVFLDDCFAFGLEEDIAYQHQLCKGLSVSPAFSAVLQEQSTRITARRTAERFIARRMRSEKELRRRLEREEIPSAIIDSVVSDLSRIGLIDDAAFAEAYVRDRMTLKPRSRLLLEKELAAKGVKKDVASLVLDKLASPEQDLVTAGSLLNKFLSRQTSSTTDVVRRRAFGYLLRRGYSVDIIMKAFSGIEDQGEDFDRDPADPCEERSMPPS